MPTLNWIGKQAVIEHHTQVPFHLLKTNADLSLLPHTGQLPVGEGVGAGNLLVQGDNLLALKALLPQYASRVKCIYIDPPYNTGNENWVYNDAVNSPEMRAWLGKTVGGEAEDLSRHDKWLCMMYPRLMLLKEFLRDDGVIFISIDNNELSHLELLMSEIFGEHNNVGTLIWKNATDNNPTNITVEHEYVLCYALNKQRLPKEWKAVSLPIKERMLKIGTEFVVGYKDRVERQAAYTKWYRQRRPFIWPFQDYKFIDDEGIYTGSRSVHNPGKEGYRYDVLHPNGLPCTQPLMGYRFPEETMRALLADNRILFGEDETKLIELKLYVKDYRAKLSSLFELDGRVGTNEIKALFPDNKRPFNFPKPTGLISELLSFTTQGTDIILDSFAGSGTTGHAVMQLNAEDGGDRRFILVEMDETICRDITAQRLKRAAAKIAVEHAPAGLVESAQPSLLPDTPEPPAPNLRFGFTYCELGEPLFGPDGDIRPSVTWDDLAAHVFFAETGTPLMRLPAWLKPLAGIANGTAVYLLYNGVLKDKRPNTGNVLTSAVLAELPPHAGPKVIFGTGCRLSPARLQALGITFRQIPYEVRIS